ncbi:MAG TPA: M48 family metalloprotease [Thermoanaerobaculia bacterium]|jgi:predicted Zn-dependent protease
MDPYYRRRSGGGFGKGRLIIAFIMALVAIAGYYGTRSYNPVTDEVQHVDITPQQEVALGLQAAPEMAQQFGGLHPDQKAQALVDRICNELVTKTSAKDTPYEYDCHVLADEETINAFALPGGQVFITAGLMGKLQTEAQLAGVLGHEIGHVVARHGAEHIAKQKLTQGLTGAAVIATYDPNDPSSRRNAAVAMLIGQLVNMRFGRQDELESDRLGVRFISEAGYDPRSMIEVMKILEASAGGGRQPEFFSTHPNPANRINNIQAAIQERFPQGVPEGLKS